MDISNEEIRSIIGERFVQIRRNIIRKNQTQMGAVLGISTDRLSDFECGKKITDPAIVYRIMQYLMLRGIDIRLLFLEDFDISKIKYKKPKFYINMNVI